MALTITTIEKVSLSIQPIDAKGFPAPVDGIPNWVVVNPDVVSLSVSPDGLSASLVALAPGFTQVGVSADARLGPDFREITGILEVNVIPAEASVLQITAGPTELQ